MAPADDSDLQYERRITAMEMQIGRLVSDAESEKETRRRVNIEIANNFEKINVRLTAIERTLWIAFGVILALELVLRIASKWL